jgi:hypothetical protein
MSKSKPVWDMTCQEYLNYIGVFVEEDIQTIIESGDDASISDDEYYVMISALIGGEKALKYMNWITHGDFRP